jgi:hypothetical protein
MTKAQFEKKIINNLYYNYSDYINVYVDVPLKNIQSFSPSQHINCHAHKTHMHWKRKVSLLVLIYCLFLIIFLSILCFLFIGILDIYALWLTVYYNCPKFYSLLALSMMIGWLSKLWHVLAYKLTCIFTHILACH